jgi:hypothetical protein
MTENHDSGSPPQELDFEKAEFDTPANPVCVSCQCPITDGYYTLGPNLVCSGCRVGAAEVRPPGNGLTRMFGALLLGALAAAIGCAVWMLVTELTGYEIGLIAIAVGFLVGGAVHFGSRNTGGLFYQLIAVFLTYTAIVMTYVPALVEEFTSSEEFTQGITEGSESVLPEGGAAEPGNLAEPQSEGPAVLPGAASTPPDAEEAATVAAWFVAIPFAYAVPFLLGFENALGILIIGFALLQAWRMNAATALDWQGPFRLGESTAGGG